MSYTRTTRRILWGLFWIALGVFLLLSTHGLITYEFSWNRDWPVIFVLVGAIMLFKLATRRKTWRRRVELNVDESDTSAEYRKQILDSLEKGEISASEAAEKLKGDNCHVG